MKKLEHLNGLRGLAALVVVVHHFAYVFLVFSTRGTGPMHFSFENVVYSTPLQLLVAGNYAVCIFFILSGFVLSYAFFQTGNVVVVQSAAIKRYFRLMPPILGSVLLSWAIVTFGFNYNRAAAALTGAPWLDNFWPRAVSFAEAVFYGVYGIIVGNAAPGLLNNALWTMKVEFLGSMLVFAFLALFGKLQRRWIVYLVLAVVLWKTYYLAFVLGIALCDFSSRSWAPKTLSWPVIAALAATGLLLGAAPIPGPTTTIYSALTWPGVSEQTAFILAHIVGAFMLLAAVIYSPLLQVIFASRPLRYLGKISFSVYLLHVLVLGSFASYLFVILSRSHGYALSMALTGVAYLAIVLIAADIYTRYVDEPAIRFASYMGRKVMSPKARSTELAPAGAQKSQPVAISRTTGTI